LTEEKNLSGQHQNFYRADCARAMEFFLYSARKAQTLECMIYSAEHFPDSRSWYSLSRKLLVGRSIWPGILFML